MVWCGVVWSEGLLYCRLSLWHVFGIALIFYVFCCNTFVLLDVDWVRWIGSTTLMVLSIQLNSRFSQASVCDLDNVDTVRLACIFYSMFV